MYGPTSKQSTVRFMIVNIKLLLFPASSFVNAELRLPFGRIRFDGLPATGFSRWGKAPV